MDFQIDAFPVDETKNGIRNTEQIKVLLCYVLRAQRAQLTRDQLTAALYDNGIANYFELNQAVEELLGNRSLTTGDDGVLTLTDKGASIADGLQRELSPFIKDKAVRVAAKTALYEKRRIENDFSVTKEREDRFRIDLRMHRDRAADPQDDLLHLTLYVTDALQAETMKTCFFNNPTRLYQNVIFALTEDAEFLG